MAANTGYFDATNEVLLFTVKISLAFLKHIPMLVLEEMLMVVRKGL